METFDNWNTEPLCSAVCKQILRVISTPLLLWFPSRDCRSDGFIRSQLVLLLPLRFALIDCRLCWLVFGECGWANPRFRLPVKDGGWLRVLFARLHYLSLLAASYPAVLQLVIKNKILRHEDRDPVTYQMCTPLAELLHWKSAMPFHPSTK